MIDQKETHLNDVINDKYKTKISGHIKETLPTKPSNRNIKNMIANKIKNQMETQSKETKRNYEVFHLLNQANSNIRILR